MLPNNPNNDKKQESHIMHFEEFPRFNYFGKNTSAGEFYTQFVDNSNCGTVIEICGERKNQEDKISMDVIKIEGGKEFSDANWEAIQISTAVDLQAGFIRILNEQPKSAVTGGTCLSSNIIVGNTVYNHSIGDSCTFSIVINPNSEVIVKEINDYNYGKPSHSHQQQRVEKAGGMIVNNRIKISGLTDPTNRGIAIAEAIGDIDYTYVDHKGKTAKATIDGEGDKYLLTACDGMYERKLLLQEEMTEKAMTIEFIRSTVEKVIKGLPPEKAKDLKDLSPKIANALLGGAFQNGSSDNITVIVTPINKDDKDVKVVTVCDGHGGDKVSDFCARSYPLLIQKKANALVEKSLLEKNDQIVVDTFIVLEKERLLKAEKSLLTEKSMNSSTTFVHKALDTKTETLLPATPEKVIEGKFNGEAYSSFRYETFGNEMTAAETFAGLHKDEQNKWLEHGRQSNDDIQALLEDIKTNDTGLIDRSNKTNATKLIDDFLIKKGNSEGAKEKNRSEKNSPNDSNAKNLQF